MDPSPGCPEDEVLRDFAGGHLSGDAARRVATHLGDCPTCRASVGLRLKVARRIVDEASTETAPTSHDGDHDEPGTTDFELGPLDPPTLEGAMGRIGDYEILDVLGGGGMGVVFKAFDHALHRMVAIKVMAARIAKNQTARKRFTREARAAAAISHSNVLVIHAVSMHHDTPYIVMEYVGGTSLRQRIKEAAPLEIDQVLRIAHQVASGLAAAHAQGVIHRDIKPANIMLEDGVNRVKIADFGLALAAIDHSGITSADQIIGTPAYMSPEQVMSSSQVDPRSDLFSLGCMMYAMLTGHSPFSAGHPLEVIRKVCDLEPPPVHEVNPKVGPELSALVHRLLAKKAEDRFQSAAAVSEGLARLLAAVNAPDSTADVPVAEKSPTPEPFPRHRWPAGLWVPAALVAAVVVLPLGWVVWPLVSNRSAPMLTPRSSVVTVAQQGRADVRSLAEALERVGPGTKIRIDDDATYTAAIRIADRKRLSGVTIESPKHAVIEAPAGSLAVFTVDGTPAVTCRGLTIRATAGQHAVLLSGPVEGLLLEDVRVEQPGSSEKAAVYVFAGGRGTSDRPIRLRRLDLHCGTLGVVLGGADGFPISWLALEESTIAGTGILLVLDVAVADASFVRNIFMGGLVALSVNLHLPGQSRSVVIDQNTFFQTKHWIGLNQTRPEPEMMSLRRNLILESGELATSDPASFGQVVQSWFRDNVWEVGSEQGAVAEQVRWVAETRDNVRLLSRDPTRANFLVPEPGAKLAGSGAGDRSFVGAKSPATTESSGGGVHGDQRKATSPP